VGKSTIADRALEAFDNMKRSVSYTTRPPRGGEKDGEEYFFIDREQFEQHIRDNDLIEWAEVYGNLYGTGKDFVRSRLEEGWNLMLEIDVKGGESVKRELPESVLIMVVPPSMEALEERLRGRGTDREETIRKRLNNALNELGHWKNYDYIVMNDRLDDAVDRVCDIIKAEAANRRRIKMIKVVENK